MKSGNGKKKKKRTFRITFPVIAGIVGLAIMAAIMAGVSAEFNDASRTLYDSATGSSIEMKQKYGNVSIEENCIPVAEEVYSQLIATERRAGEAAATLANVYCERTDLQLQFSIESSDNIDKIISWSCSVSTGNVIDESVELLEPYSNQYCDTAISMVELQIDGYEELFSSMKEFAEGEELENIENAIELVGEAKELVEKSDTYNAQLKLDDILDVFGADAETSG